MWYRWIDEIVKDAPWVVTPEFLAEHDIDYVAHDDLPYGDASGQAKDVYDFVRLCGYWTLKWDSLFHQLTLVFFQD